MYKHKQAHVEQKRSKHQEHLEAHSMSLSSEDTVVVHPEDLRTCGIRRIGCRDLTGQKFKRSLKSGEKVPESARRSPALWHSEPDSPPRKKTRTSSSIRRDDSREWSWDHSDRDPHHRERPKSSDQGSRHRSLAGAISSRNRSTTESESGPILTSVGRLQLWSFSWAWFLTG